VSSKDRAPPLPADARRASIIAATLPLLRTYGTAVTTAQIALAAGVAEGTLFRVFPDKESLIAAAIASAFDPGPTEAMLAAIDRSQPLREALIQAVAIMQTRVERIWSLLAVLGMNVTPPDFRARNAMTERMSEADTRMRNLLAEIFAAHRNELRVDPDHAARLMRAFTFAGTHPRISELPLTPGEVVTVLLDGIRSRPDEDDDEELS